MRQVSGSWDEMDPTWLGMEMKEEREEKMLTRQGKWEAERITPGMCQYPALLREIPDFPKQLYCKGKVELLKERCVAVVGSRNTTTYGRSTAVKFAGAIAGAGLTVVSGMARGIDTCAHRGALDAGGGTVAVLGCGVDICYPAENVNLKREIEEKGLVVSEYHPDEGPKKYYFPQRNRIISGLSEMTLVIQAGIGSGALITAGLAADQGREICTVPGNVDSQYNMGSNKLIQEGACVVLNPGDVLEIMGVSVLEGRRAEEMLGESELRIFKVLEKQGEMTVDELCRAIGKSPSYVAGIVAVMEMKGVVFSGMGKIFIAKG